MLYFLNKCGYDPVSWSKSQHITQNDLVRQPANFNWGNVLFDIDFMDINDLPTAYGLTEYSRLHLYKEYNNNKAEYSQYFWIIKSKGWVNIKVKQQMLKLQVSSS